MIDPFAGTHATAVAAWMCGCKYIGADVDEKSVVCSPLQVCVVIVLTQVAAVHWLPGMLKTYKRLTGLFGSYVIETSIDDVIV